ncbi:MAG: flagellar basal body-associated FliL family protein [Peptococcaceae bacterium]|nr:flagellar basal body-associated FliL family protein [Peptococcaceae bacterium]
MAKTKISENNEEKAGKNGKPKKKKTILIVLVILVLLAGSSAGAYMFFLRPAAQAGEVKKTKVEEKESLDMGEVIVNLNGSSSHYLRAKVTIDYPKNKKLAEELKKKKHIVSDVIIATLRSKTLAEVSNASALQGLKSSLIEEINNKLDAGEITGVYFTDFLVK